VSETLSYQLQYGVTDISELETIQATIAGLENVAAVSRHYLAVPAVQADEPSPYWDANDPAPVVPPRENVIPAQIEQPASPASILADLFPNDSEYDEDADGDFLEHWTPASPAGNNWDWEYIQAPSAWMSETGSSDVVVAVIDADFDRDHSDLNDNIQAVQGSRTPARGHGTHVAGTICAEGNNGQGVTGMAWDCSLRLYDVGSGGGVVAALKTQQLMVQAAQDGARIVNMSLQWIDNNRCGVTGTNATLQKVKENNDILGRGILLAEREERDVLWVFAAGNECRDAQYASPASLTQNFPLNTMAVAATDVNGALGPFSNFGSLVTVAAPGVDILSTTPRTCTLLLFCTDQYDLMSGTSMAAPHVSGLAALVLAFNSDFTATQVKQCIVSAAQNHGAQVSGQPFFGVNAPEAIRCQGEVDLPSKVDIVFSLDLTSSMIEEVARVKAEIQQIITNLRLRVSPSTDFRFGVVTYEDYVGAFNSVPCGSSYSAVYGSATSKPGGDMPFRIDQTLITDGEQVKSAVAGLVLGFGEDGPESYGRVFWELGQNDTGATIGWRSDSLRLVVNFGDSIPHDPNLNEGVPSPPFPSFDTGVDPGRNLAIDCGGDDIDFQDDALAAMTNANVRLLHIHSGLTTAGPYWQYWASVTGGAFAQINSDGTIPGGLDLTDLIISLLGLAPE
jgi:hypothetical protein